jgi:hypothetical protein
LCWCVGVLLTVLMSHPIHQFINATNNQPPHANSTCQGKPIHS